MSILIKPIITEKATDQSELSNCFSFVVKKTANKIEVKEAVESSYGVTVKVVRTMNYPVYRSTKYTKKGLVSNMKGAYKKAIVQLAEGENIDFYSNIYDKKMALRKLKPITPGQRFKVVTDFDVVTTDRPEKSLLAPIKRTGGRNSEGKMTMRFLGGGHKRRYRVIDFKRNKDGIPATVKTIEYDPNRTAYIALLNYADGEKKYVIAQSGLKVGQQLVSGEKVAPEIGNTMLLSNIPLGTVISCIELRPGQGAVIARSAGTFAQLMAREGKYATIKLPSGEIRMILLTCKATIGVVSNSDHQLTVSGKAGRSRWLGRRPRTRPVAMNPVDHPMGGGEGRASGGHPRSKNGIPAKGFKTRSKTKASNRQIVERRKK